MVVVKLDLHKSDDMIVHDLRGYLSEYSTTGVQPIKKQERPHKCVKAVYPGPHIDVSNLGTFHG